MNKLIVLFMETITKRQMQIVQQITQEDAGVLAALADVSKSDQQPMAEELGNLIIKDYAAGDENLKRYFDSKRKRHENKS